MLLLFLAIHYRIVMLIYLLFTISHVLTSVQFPNEHPDVKSVAVFSTYWPVITRFVFSQSLTCSCILPSNCILCFRVLEKQPHTNSFVRTTTAVTMFNAGIKVVFIEYQVQRSKKTNKQTQGCIKIKMYPSYNLKVNVIPSHAEAVVNMRIHSAHSLKEVKT